MQNVESSFWLHEVSSLHEFSCQSDHNLLEDIHLKHLSDAPSRLQKLLLKIQPYDFVIKHVPGIKILMTDTFSKVSSQEDQNQRSRCYHQ